MDTGRLESFSDGVFAVAIDVRRLPAVSNRSARQRLLSRRGPIGGDRVLHA
jgi:hypothetical protein